MPPTDRPLPRFVAEPPRELEPYGRWAELLGKHFETAWKRIESDEPIAMPGPITWFPERTHAGRTYVPAIAPAEGGTELFGYVSFVRASGSPDPEDFTRAADYTAETAERNPHWRLDLNEEVIGRWRGPGKAEGELTLVWGTPLVPGGAAVTAELGDETVDQCALQQDRFTLIALDAVKGFGPDLFLEIKLWNRRGDLLASETLYEDSEEE